jgi:hypothetical protein
VQPYVSRKLRDFEEEFGFRIFAEIVTLELFRTRDERSFKLL